MKSIPNFDLKNASWVKIGGKAKEYIEFDNPKELEDFLINSKKDQKDFEIFGWGANTLFSDEGLNTTVIKVKTNIVNVLDGFKPTAGISNLVTENTNLRHKAFKNEKITSGFDTDDLNYSEADAEDVYIYLSAGVSLPFAINDLISKGITGLSMFSGIPGTIGGAVFNNIHGGKRLLSEFIYSVDVIDDQGNKLTLLHDELDFDYNSSKIKNQKLSVVGAIFRLKLGDKEKARNAAIEWTRRKASQPKNSLGSVFHNLEPEVQEKFKFPTGSLAYVIEHVLNLSGYRVGGIMIPEKTASQLPQINKNIFMNVDNGTASDYLAVMKKVSDECYMKIGIRPKTEVFLKGFNEEEIKIFL